MNSGIVFSRTNYLYLSLWGVAFALFLQPLYAQPVLTFDRIINNWNKIELYFSVACNGNPINKIDKGFITVNESGRDITNFELRCPDSVRSSAMSVALVLDASGSMAGVWNAALKELGASLVDQLDDPQDEACLIWFNQQVTVAQSFTSDKSILKKALDTLPAIGKKLVREGINEGISEVAKNGISNNRVVIVITDGTNLDGKGIYEGIISEAARKGVRIFTIAVGPSVNRTHLSSIALRTGGQYYESPEPEQADSLFADIRGILRGYQNFMISYYTWCSYGSFRPVILSLKDFCGGNDIKTRTFFVYYDTSAFIPLSIRIGKKTDFGNKEVCLPLTIETNLSDDILAPITFNLLYDAECVQFKNISTPTGSFWENVPITLTKIPGGISVKTHKETIVSGPGTFAEFVFHTSDPIGDTVCCPIKLEKWSFEQGSFRPMLRDGEICIIPRSLPRILSACNAPKELKWNEQTNDYDPNPFTVELMLTNTGEIEARNVRYKITYAQKDLTAVSPIVDIQYDARQILIQDAFTEGKWDLLAKPRTTGDSVLISIAAAFDNHDSVRCSMKVWIPPASATTSTDIGGRILNHALYQNYPNPFNPSTVIEYELPKPEHVRLIVCDVFGREIRTLTDEWKESGRHRAIFHADEIPSGMYTYRIITRDYTSSRNMTLIR